MAKVVDLKEYKTAKTLKREYDQLIDNYKYIHISLEVIQAHLSKWGKYRGPGVVSYKLEEVKVFLEHEIIRLKVLIKKQKDILDVNS